MDAGFVLKVVMLLRLVAFMLFVYLAFGLLVERVEREAGEPAQGLRPDRLLARHPSGRQVPSRRRPPPSEELVVTSILSQQYAMK